MYLITLNLSAYTFKSNTQVQKVKILIFKIYIRVLFVQRKYSHYRHEGLGLGTVSVFTAPSLVLH